MGKELGCVGRCLEAYWGVLPPAFNTYQEMYMGLTWSEQLGGECGLGWGGVLVGEGVGREGKLEGLSCNVCVPCSMLSHMCGSWYFPRFLFNIGSLTLINIASFMVLE